MHNMGWETKEMEKYTYKSTFLSNIIKTGRECGTKEVELGFWPADEKRLSLEFKT